MTEYLQIIKAGANKLGLRLIGDAFIGFRFVPRCDAADAADDLLEFALAVHEIDGADWLAANRDGPYRNEDWNARAHG